MVLSVKEPHLMGLYTFGRGSKPPAGQTHEGHPRKSVRKEKLAPRDW